MHRSQAPFHKNQVINGIPSEYEILIVRRQPQWREVVLVIQKVNGGQRGAGYLQSCTQRADIDSRHEVADTAYDERPQANARMKRSFEECFAPACRLARTVELSRVETDPFPVGRRP